MSDEPILRENVRTAVRDGKLPVRRPDRTSGGPVDALTDATMCLPCLGRATALPESQVIESLRRLGPAVIITVRACSTCGDGVDRLVCGLPDD